MEAGAIPMMCRRCGGSVWRGLGCVGCGEPTETPTAEPIVEPAAYVHWSAQEEAYVRANMAELKHRELAANLTRFAETGIGPAGEPWVGVKRSLKSVKQYFARYGISKPVVRSSTRGPRRRIEPGGSAGSRLRRWSEEELLALECGELKLLAHRTISAMKLQAWRGGYALRSGDGCLSLRQAAEAGGVHHWEVRRLVDAGKLPATRNGRLWRIDPADAERIAGMVGSATGGTKRTRNRTPPEVVRPMVPAMQQRRRRHVEG